MKKMGKHVGDVWFIVIDSVGAFVLQIIQIEKQLSYSNIMNSYRY